MPHLANRAGLRLRELADDAHRVASDLATLASQVEQPSRSIARADQLIARGERIAADFGETAVSVRRVFRG